MPEKVGQKIDYMGVSRDEFRRFLRKANIAYFAAKNDLVQKVTKFSRSS